MTPTAERDLILWAAGPGKWLCLCAALAFLGVCAVTALAELHAWVDERRRRKR